jgi:hypothetical protein
MFGDDDDGGQKSTQHVDTYKTWVEAQVNKGSLTQRDLAWILKDPPSYIEFYPVSVSHTDVCGLFSLL